MQVPFNKVLARSNLTAWWQGSTVDGINVLLGPIGANKIQSLVLGKETAQHVLVAGKTGSGKSTLLHVLITTLALNYSPDVNRTLLEIVSRGKELAKWTSMVMKPLPIRATGCWLGTEVVTNSLRSGDSP